jgi:dipeptidyl-peptidase-4
MRQITKTLFLLLLTSLSVVGQNKITLEDIWTGKFRTEGMDELHSMKNTNQYTVLNFDRTSRSMQIDLYDFATLNKVSTLIDTKDYPELKSIDSYTFNKKESKLLIASNS